MNRVEQIDPISEVDPQTPLKKSPKLSTLPIALDPGKIHPYLESLARQWVDPRAKVGQIQIEILRQRTQRCVIRYRIGLHLNGSRKARTWRVIGKVFKPGRGESTFAVMEKIWQAGFQSSAEDGISIPQPYGFISELCMLFQEEALGKPYKEVLQERPSPELLRRLALGLAKFHRAPIAQGPPLSLREYLLRCHPRYPFLWLALPDTRPKIEYIIQQAQQWIENRPYTPATIHGDFHLGQIHVDKKRLWLIDFDAITCGDPAADVGNLLVFLRGKVKKQPELAEMLPAFFETYFQEMGWEILQRVPVYEALTHLRRACKLLRKQEKGWSRKIHRMLDKGMQCMLQVREGTVTVHDILQR